MPLLEEAMNETFAWRQCHLARKMVTPTHNTTPLTRINVEKGEGVNGYVASSVSEIYDRDC